MLVVTIIISSFTRNTSSFLFIHPARDRSSTFTRTTLCCFAQSEVHLSLLELHSPDVKTDNEPTCTSSTMANLIRSHRHNEGIGRVAYTPDGALLYSGGSDGFVRVFSAKPEDEHEDQLKLLDYHDDTAVYSMDASVSLSSAAEAGWKA